MIGRTLAHYRITAAIGEGGMGQVYRATDLRLGRDIALKVLPAQTASNPEMLERFRREARAVAALNHPNIVTIHSVEEAEGLHFLTMELVPGRTLDQLIPEGGLEVSRVLGLARALSGALAAAHDKGIVHRDLKPANIMVTDDGAVKVLDFGLAKFETAEAAGANSELSTAMKTSSGVVMGTRPYMSPEQVQGRALDHRTDIFSMGVVLYQASTGKRPFQGASSADLFASILRDTAPPVTESRADLPSDLARVIRRCLEKDPSHRIQTARDVSNELRDSSPAASPVSQAPTPLPSRAPASGGARADEGFWLAVLPFSCPGSNADVAALAEGLSEEIITGLARFSYLKVVARGSTRKFANQAIDVKSVSSDVGARYVMEGSLRHAGTQLRLAVQLVDATTGAHLWAETYNRPFDPDRIFELQDDLVPQIVSAVADSHGVLPRTLSEALRGKSPDELTPYEAVLRSFGYGYRISSEEHALVQAALERAVERAPSYSDAWGMLSLVYAEGFANDFNSGPDPLGKALMAARRAAEADPGGAIGFNGLARAHFFRKEFPAFRTAAERTLEVNPFNSPSVASMGLMFAYSGDWENGCALVERATRQSPRHPGWFWLPLFYNAFRKADYPKALNIALKVNLPHYSFAQAALAIAYAQLGQREAAAAALKDLLALRPDFGSNARREYEKWFLPEFVDRLLEGLDKAGLTFSTPSSTPIAIPTPTPLRTPSRLPPSVVALAVLPFSDLSAARDQQYLCEGMAEEIMTALMRIDGLQVASRTSTFRARQDNSDLPAIARVLSVNHVLEGSVRTAGERLRVTAQLTDVATGFQVWSERFDRDTRDVFAVQDEIAAGVVGAVKARLAPGAAIPLPARPQVAHLDAYRHYLQGRHLRYSKNDHAGALRSFEAALALDPSHAPSLVGLAEVRVLAAMYGLVPAHENYSAAKEGIEAAGRIQGPNAESLYVLGMIAVCGRDWKEAERLFLRSLELDPGEVRSLCWLANVLVLRGELDGARERLSRARNLDPLAPYPYAMSGFNLLMARKPEEALLHLEQALAFDAENTLSLWTFGMALVAVGRSGEAVSALDRAPGRSSTSHMEAVRGWTLAAAGRRTEARDVLAALRTRPTTAPALVPEGWLLAALGETDAAFEVFERAVAQNQGTVAFVGLPPFDSVRDDPRFAALVARLGFGQE